MSLPTRQLSKGRDPPTTIRCSCVEACFPVITFAYLKHKTITRCHYEAHTCLENIDEKVPNGTNTANIAWPRPPITFRARHQNQGTSHCKACRATDPGNLREEGPAGPWANASKRRAQGLLPLLPQLEPPQGILPLLASARGLPQPVSTACRKGLPLPTKRPKNP